MKTKTIKRYVQEFEIFAHVFIVKYKNLIFLHTFLLLQKITLKILKQSILNILINETVTN